MRIPDRLIRATFLLGIALVILVSLSPRETLPAFARSNGVGHFAAYVGLAVIGAFGYRGRTARLRLASGLAVLGGAAEILQTLVPGRNPDVVTVLVNWTGIGAGLLAAYAFVRWRASRSAWN